MGKRRGVLAGLAAGIVRRVVVAGENGVRKGLQSVEKPAHVMKVYAQMEKKMTIGVGGSCL